MGTSVGFEEDLSYTKNFFGAAPGAENSVFSAMSNLLFLGAPGRIRSYIVSGGGLERVDLARSASGTYLPSRMTSDTASVPPRRAKCRTTLMESAICRRMDSYGRTSAKCVCEGSWAVESPRDLEHTSHQERHGLSEQQNHQREEERHEDQLDQTRESLESLPHRQSAPVLGPAGQYIPPAPGLGGCFFSSGISDTSASVVSRREAMDAEF